LFHVYFSFSDRFVGVLQVAADVPLQIVVRFEDHLRIVRAGVRSVTGYRIEGQNAICIDINRHHVQFWCRHRLFPSSSPNPAGKSDAGLPRFAALLEPFAFATV
jgi:hypothetical protein